MPIGFNPILPTNPFLNTGGISRAVPRAGRKRRQEESRESNKIKEGNEVEESASKEEEATLETAQNFV